MEEMRKQCEGGPEDQKDQIQDRETTTNLPSLTYSNEPSILCFVLFFSYQTLPLNLADRSFKIN